jgi:energy-coupling factor transport system substrate-specific component
MKHTPRRYSDKFQFGRQELVYSAIGASLYMVLEVAAGFIRFPAISHVTFRPAAVIPMFFGVAFGPWVGLLSGLGGNLFGDLMSQQGFWPWWNLGNGLMGFLPGLFWLNLGEVRQFRSILKVEAILLLGGGAGMGLASLSEMWVSQQKIFEVLVVYFYPMFFSNALSGLVLVPIFLVLFRQQLINGKYR